MARVRWMALTTRNLPSARKARSSTKDVAGTEAEVPASGSRSVAASRADLDTALSYESTADEITFVLGPALVGILASWLLRGCLWRWRRS